MINYCREGATIREMRVFSLPSIIPFFARLLPTFFTFILPFGASAQCPPVFPDGISTLSSKINACNGVVQITAQLAPTQNLSNVSMTLTLPTGIKFEGLVPPTTATAVQVGNQVTISNLGSISSAAPRLVRFNVSADFSAANQPNILYKIDWTGGTCNDDGDPLTVDKPIINIVSLNPVSAAVPTPNGTFTRTVRVCNDGFGSTRDTIRLTDRHASDVTLLSATINGVPLSMIGDSVMVITRAHYGADSTLVKNECLDIVQTLRVNGCGQTSANGTLSTLTARLNACNGQPAQVSNPLSGNAVVGGGGPQLVVVSQTSGLDNACFSNVRTQTYSFQNTGQDTARSIRFDVVGNGFLKFVTGSLTATRNGTAITPTLSSSSFAGTASAQSCIGAGMVNNATYSLPDLPPGQTYVVTYQMQGCCVGACQNFVASDAPRVRYERLCPPTGGTLTLNLQGFNHTTSFPAPQTDYPTFVGGGTCFSIEILNRTIVLPFNATSNTVRLEVNVPAGITPNGNYSLTTADNRTITPLSTTFSGGVLALEYPMSSVQNLSGVKWNLGFCTSGCPSCVGGVKNFTFNEILKPTACAACSGVSLYCGTAASVNVICPACSTTSCEGVNLSNYSMFRTGFCQLDSDNNRVSDGVGVNAQLLRLQRATIGDTVTITYGGRIQTSAANPAWQYLYVSDQIKNIAPSNTPYFTLLDNSVRIFRAGSPLCTKTTLPTVTTLADSTRYLQDLSVSTMACAGLTSYLNNDSFYITTRYIVTGNPGNLLSSFASSTNMYTTTTAGAGAATKYTCQWQYANFTVAGYVQEITGFSGTSNAVTCGGSGPAITFRSEYGGVSNPFPYEYRALSVPDSFSITVPTGYALNGIRAVLTAGTGVTTLANIATNAVKTVLGNGDTLYRLDLRALFSNTFPAPAGMFYQPDESYTLALTPQYAITTSTCSNVPKNATLTGRFRNLCMTAPVLPVTGATSGTISQLDFQEPTFQSPVLNTLIIKQQRNQCWTINPVALNPNGTNYFIRITPPTTADSISNVTVVANGTTISPSATDPTLYFIGQNPDNLQICATFTGCSDTSRLRLDMGYQCNSVPPINWASVTCPTIPINLKAAPNIQTTSYEVSPTPLSNLPDLCTPIEFSVTVRNTGVGFLYDPQFSVYLPPKLAYIRGSARLEYKGVVTSIPDGSLTPFVGTANPNDTTLLFNLKNLPAPNDSLGILGLAGSASGLSGGYREYEIFYQVMPLCGFKVNSQMTYSTLFTDACGYTKNRTTLSSRIGLNIPGTYNTQTGITGNLQSVTACGTGTAVNVASTIQGPGSTGNADSIYIRIPPSLYVVPSSFSGFQNIANTTPIKRVEGVDTFYVFRMNAGLTTGQQARLMLNVLAKDTARCNLTDSLSAEVIAWKNAPCSILNLNCVVPISSGTATSNFAIQKPAVSFLANSVTNNVDATGTTISLRLRNTSAINLNANELNVKIYYDADNSGTFTAGDQLLDDSQMPSPINANGSAVYYKRINTTAPRCPIIAVIGGACVCGSATLGTTLCNTPPFCEASGQYSLPTSVCQGTTATFAPSGAVNTDFYDYQWTFPSSNQINAVNTPPFTSTIPTSNVVRWNTAGTYAVKYLATLKVSPNTCRDSSTQNFVVKPNPTVNSIPNYTVRCENDPLSIAAFASTPTGATFTWTNSNTAIGLAASGSGNIATFTPPTNNTNTNRVATITVTPTLNGCVGAPFSFTITKEPTPVINQPANSIFCPSQTVAATPFSAVIGATAATPTFAWTRTNTAIGTLATSGTVNLPSYTSATNTTNANIVSTITATATFPNGCTSQRNFTHTLRPTPSVNAPANFNACAGTTLSRTFASTPSGSTFAWTNNNTTTGLAASGSGNISFLGTNTGTTDLVSTISVTPTLNTCVGLPVNFTATVKPIPTVDQPANITVCPGQNISALFTGAIAGTTYNWTNSNTAIGLAASGSGNLNVTAASNTTGANITATISVTPVFNACNGTARTLTITVKPTPVLTTTNYNFCINDAASLNFTNNITTGQPVTYSWTNDNTATGIPASGTSNPTNFTATSNSSSTAVVSNLTVTATANGCTSPSVNVVARVNPRPSMLQPDNMFVCGGQVITTAFVGSLAGTTFNWTNDNTAVGLAASGSGNVNFTAATNNTAAPITANITVTPILNGCAGQTKSFAITIPPTPSVTQPSNLTVCGGQSINQVFATSPSGTTVSWTNSNAAIGLPTSGSGNITYSAPTVTTQQTATITVTPTINGCSGTPRTFTITINPMPTVNDVVNQSVCAGAIVSVPLSGNLSGTTYSWTNSNTSIGLAASGTGSINFTSAATITTEQTATITVTPSLNGCVGAPKTFTIIVKPTPSVTQPANVAVCGGQPVGVSFTASPSGTTVNWSNTNTGIGLAASGSGNISYTAPTVSSPQTGTITATPTLNGCVGTPRTFTIAVAPAPTVNAIADQNICAGLPLTLNFSGSQSGTTYTWTNSNTSIGIAALGSGNINATTPSVTTAQTATITVTPSLNGCVGVPMSFTVTVKPTPSVTQPASVTACANQPVAVNLTTNPAGTTVNWSNSNVNIGLGTSGTGNISFTAANVASPQTSTVLLSPVLNGCTGSLQSFTIAINPMPIVSTVSDQIFCGTQTVSIPLIANQLGTNLNWVNDNPAIGLAAAGSGNLNFTAADITTVQTANITVTPSLNGCVGTPMTFKITVKPTPKLTTINDQTVCSGSPVSANFTASHAGSAINWTNDNTTIGLAASGTGNIAFTSNPLTTPALATITARASFNGCTSLPMSFNIAVSPTPSVNAIANQTLCGNQPLVVTMTASHLNTFLNWTNSNPAATGLPATGNGSINLAAIPNPTSVQTATFVVTPSLNGCAGTPVSFTITIKPTPSVIPQTVDQTVCMNTPVTVNFATTPVGIVYNWTNNNTLTGLAASGTGDISLTTATVTAQQVSRVIVTPTLNGCVGTPDTFNLTVKPTPSVNAVSSQTVCGGLPLAVNFASPSVGTTYTWTNDNPAIGLAATGSGNINFTSVNAATNQTATITVTPSFDGCVGTPISFTITVKPTPSVNATVDQTVCGNNPLTINYLGSPSGTVFDWTNNNTLTGLAASGSGNVSFTTANVSAQQISRVIVTPSLNGCIGATDTFDIRVNPTPTVNAVGNQMVCGGLPLAVNFASPLSGTTFSWTNSNPNIGLAASGSGNLSFTSANPTANETATITVTPSVNGCVGTPITFTITVKPTPSVIATVDQSVCGNNPLTINFLSNPSGATFNWTNDNTLTGLAASGSGNISFTTANVASTRTSRVIVSPILNGCVGAPDTFLITVAPVPTVNVVGNQMACGGQNLSLNFTGNQAGATYSWTNSNPNIGLAASGTGNLNFTTANPTTNEVATITVTPTLNGCVGTPMSFTITVKPTPSVMATVDQTVCSTNPLTINILGSPAGTIFNWTNNNTATGLGASGTGDISFTAANATAVQTSRVIVLPTLNGCLGTPDTFNITVNPTPSVNSVSNQTACGGQDVLVNFAGNLSGTTYTWTNDNPAIGLAASGSGNLNFTTTNPTTNQTATITVTPTFGSCVGTPMSFTILVKPTPSVIPATADQTLCGGQPLTVNFTNPVAGTTFNWTNNNTATGLAASGTGDISFTTANVTTPRVSRVIVSPTLNGCTGVSDTFLIAVNPMPTVNAVANQTLCGGQPLSLNFGGNQAGTTYTWTNDNANIGLAASGSGNINFTSTNPSTNETANITVTPSLNGCVGTPINFTILVKPTPSVNMTADQTLCGSNPLTINFLGSPAATNFNWTNNNTATGIAASGSGDIVITTAAVTSSQTSRVIVTPVLNGCLGAPDTFFVTVNPTPTVTTVASQTVCGSQPLSVNFGGNLAGTTFNWTNDNPAIGLAANGSGNLNFTTTNPSTDQTANITVMPTFGTCVGTPMVFTITVKPTPSVNTTADIAICGNAPLPINFSGTPSGVLYAWTNSNTLTGLAASGTGNMSFTTANVVTTQTSQVIVTPNLNGCVGAKDTFTITVSPLPTVNTVSNQTLCGNDTLGIVFAGSQTGTTYNWTNDNPAIGLAASGKDTLAFRSVNPTTVQTANITVTPVIGGCVGTPLSFSITLKPKPVLTATRDTGLCGSNPLIINYLTNPTATVNWTNSNPLIGLAASGSGTINFTTANNPTSETGQIIATPILNGCAGTPDTFTITVSPTPSVNAVSNQTACGNQNFTLNFTGSQPLTTYDWTNDNPSIGLAATGSGNLNFTTTNPTSVQTANITVTPRVGSCVGAPVSFTITLKPTPILTATRDTALCGANPLTINYLTNPIATVNWTNSNVNIGLAASGTGNISFTTSNGATSETGQIIATASLNGCAATSDTFTITVSPTPTVNSVGTQNVCGGAPLTVNFTGSQPLTTYDWTNDNPAIGLAASGSGNLNFTATNGATAQTANITVTPKVGSCVGTPIVFIISVKPTPSVSATRDTLICGSKPLTINYLTNPTATVNWTNSNTAIGLAAAGTGNISFTTANFGVSQTAEIIATPSLNGCIGTPDTFNITLSPTPTVNAVSNQILCGGQPLNLLFVGSPTGTVYNWTNSNTAIGLAASGSDSLVFTANNPLAQENATIVVTPMLNGCAGTPLVFTITVKPTPILTPSVVNATCGGGTVAVNFNKTPTAATVAWTNSNPLIGLAASGSGNINFVANSSASVQTAQIIATPSLNGCVGKADTFSMAIKPTPSVDAVSNAMVCGGLPFTQIFSGALATTVYNWTNDNTAIGLAASGSGSLNFVTTNLAPTQTATITVTPNLDGCLGTPISFTITVKPTPSVTASRDTAICAANPLTINFLGNPAGTVFNWTNTNTNIGLGASGVGNINFTTANIANQQFGEIVVTPVLNGCVGASDTFTITVSPVPTVNVVSNATLCGNDSLNLVFGGNLNGTTYSWTNDNANIGLAASGTNRLKFVSLNPTTIQTANITVTPSLDGCAGVPTNFTITIKPNPSVTATRDTAVCGSTPLIINLLGNLIGTDYNWTNSNTGIGLGVSGVGNLNFTTANVVHQQIGQIIVTPVLNGCVGVMDTFIITVSPVPTVNVVGNQMLCGNDSLNLVFGGNLNGTTYTWTNDNANIGLAASGTNRLKFVSPNPTTVQIANITVTPSLDGCAGVPINFTITVKPTPSVNTTRDTAICGTNPLTINLLGQPAGTVVNWTNNNIAIGLAASGSGNVSFTTSNVTQIERAEIVVTPTLNGCVGASDIFDITVAPMPTVNAVANQIACGNDSLSLDFIGAVSSTVYNWTNSNPAIGLAANGSGALNFRTLNPTTNQTATITVTPMLGNCAGVPMSFTITVKPTPSVTATRDTVICANNLLTINLLSNPSGTILNWTNDNTLTGLASGGTGAISFTTANNLTPQLSRVVVTPTLAGCTGATDTFVITVSPVPSVNVVSNQTLCGNDSLQLVFTGSPTGTTYNWTNDNAAIGLTTSGNDTLKFTALNPNTVQTSQITVTPTLNGCVGTPISFTITVKPTPSVIATRDTGLCATLPLGINFTSQPSSTVLNWTNSNSLIGLAANGVGNISFTTANVASEQTGQIIVSPILNGCAGAKDTFNVTVSPVPTVNAVANQTLCGGDSLRYIFTGNPAFAQFSWTNDNPSIGLAASGSDSLRFTSVNPSTVQTANITVTPSIGGCVGTPMSFTITVKPTPSVLATRDTAVCGDQVLKIPFLTNPTATVNWTNSNTNIGIVATGAGNLDFITTNNPTTQTGNIILAPILNGCVGQNDTFSITVDPKPSVNTVTDQSICSGGTVSVNFTGSHPTAQYFWTNDNGSIGLASNGTGNFSFTVLSPVDTVAKITVSPFLNGCYGVAKTFVINIKRTPTLLATPDTAICGGQLTDLRFTTNPRADVQWTNDNVGIGLAAAGVGNINFLSTDVATPRVATVIAQPILNGCVGASDTFSIIVKARPTVDVIADQTVCNRETVSAIFTGNQSSAIYAWTNDNPAIGLAASGVGNINFTALSPTALTATITVVPQLDGCAGLPKSFKISVKPTPSVIAHFDTAFCGQTNVNIVLTPLPTGAVTWTNDNTQTGLAANGSGNLIFTTANVASLQNSQVVVKPELNGCFGQTDTFILTVTPTPTVNAMADAAVCGGDSIKLVLSGTPMNNVFDWTNDNPAIGLATSGTGDIVFKSINATTQQTATVTVTPRQGNCIGNAKTFRITVKPMPIIVATADTGFCGGQNVVLPIMTVPTVAVFWTNSNTTTGLAASGNGNVVFTTANVATPQMSLVVVTPALNGCVGIADTFNLNVAPKPTVFSQSDVTICSGDTLRVPFRGAVAGTTFNWTNDNPTIGLAASGTDSIKICVNTATPQTATISVTPMLGNCAGTPMNFRVIIKPTPSVMATRDTILCGGLPLNIAFNSSTAGTQFEWTNTNQFIGLTAFGSGNIGFTTNAVVSPQTGQIVVKPTLNGCFGTTDTFNITITPTPTVDFVADQTICSGQLTQVVFTGSPLGATYEWTNDNATIGLASTGTGDIIFTPNSVLTNQTATITVTPRLNSCVGVPRTFQISLRPTPSVIATADTGFCGDLATAIPFTLQPSGATLEWTNSNPNIGLPASGSGNLSFTTRNLTTAQTATIIATPKLNGCAGTPDTFELSVSPTPLINDLLARTVCGCEQTQVNFGSNVAGTQFAWTNDNASIGLTTTGTGNLDFKTLAAPTDRTAFITVTPQLNGCEGTPKTLRLNVKATPTLDTSANQMVCTGQSVRVNFRSDIAGTLFDWTNSNTRIGLVSSGTGNIRINATPNTGQVQTGRIVVTPEANGCTGDPDTFNITVSPTPTMDAVEDVMICSGDSVSVPFVSGINGVTYTWTHSNPNISLAQNGSGDINQRISTTALTNQIAYFTVTPSLNGCEGLSQTFVLTVKPTPTVATVDTVRICGGELLNINFNSNFSSTTYGWTNSNPAIGLPASGSGNISATMNPILNAPRTAQIQVTPQYRGCSGKAKTIEVILNPMPTVNVLTDMSLCYGEPFQKTFSGIIAGTVYEWTNSNPNIGLPVSGVGNINLTTLQNSTNSVQTAVITVTPVFNGCRGAAVSFRVTVAPSKKIGLGVKVRRM